jgi:Tol biopolymer transport system component
MRRATPYLAALLAAFSVSSVAIGGASESLQISITNGGIRLLSASGSASRPPSVSADGALVAFETMGAGVRADTNGTADVYVRDHAEGTTTLVSRNPRGAAGNGASSAPSLSNDGGAVAFQSLAGNLVDGDGNGAADVFVRPAAGEDLVRVSSAAGGGDADGASGAPSLSGDGSTVAFCSAAANLVDGDDNGAPDAFVADVESGALERIAPPTDAPAGGGCVRTAVNSDGSIVALTHLGSTGDDTGGVAQVFVHYRTEGETTQITTGQASSGLAGLSISDDGRIVAFDSAADDITEDDSDEFADVFAWDRDSGGVTLVSRPQGGGQANGESGSFGVGLSGDGRWVVFGSAASNLLEGDANGSADVFRLDREEGALSIASVDINGRAAGAPSYSPDANEDGTVVAFTSLANNITLGDRNKQPDVFLRPGDFPDVAGSGEAQGGTPTPTSITGVPRDDDGGSPWLAIGVLAMAAAACAAGGYYWLGRRPAA